jgi:hypothetical protein
MITARFEFLEGQGDYWCPGVGQDVIEVKFEGIDELIETVRELEPAIRNCIAKVGEKVIDLRAISGLSETAG